MRGWLKEIREIKGLSQAQVAEAAGLSAQMYNFVENGKRCEASKVDTEKAIAAALGFNWTRFFEDDRGQ